MLEYRQGTSESCCLQASGTTTGAPPPAPPPRPTSLWHHHPGAPPPRPTSLWHHHRGGTTTEAYKPLAPPPGESTTLTIHSNRRVAGVVLLGLVTFAAMGQVVGHFLPHR